MDKEKDTVSLIITSTDPKKLSNPWMIEGGILQVCKKSYEKYLPHQSHPRQYHYQVPIINCQDLDNNIEFWVTSSQWKKLLLQSDILNPLKRTSKN